MNAGVHARARGADVSFRDVKIKIPDRADVNDVIHRKRAEDFGRFQKSQFVELSPASEREGWLSPARRSQASGLVAGATHVGGGGSWKSQKRKNVYVSPYVEEPLNSKVIKKFRTWTEKS